MIEAMVGLFLLISALQPPPAPLEKPGVVEGVVIDSMTRAPIPNAEVRIRFTRPTDGSRGMTAANTAGPKMMAGIDGRFRLEVGYDIPFELRVRAEGYVEQNDNLFGPVGTTYSVKSGESKNGIVLAIARACSLSGRLIDAETGKPIAGLRVRSWRKGTSDGEVFYLPGGEPAETSEDGAYEMKGLEPGEYFISVEPPVQPKVRIPPERPEPRVKSYSAAWYPGGADRDAALPVRVHPGARLDGLDMKLTALIPLVVRGRVRLDGDPQPVTFLIAQPLASDSMRYSMLGQLDTPGPFEITGLAPSNCVLYVFTPSKTRAERRSALASFALADRDIEDLDLTLLPGVRLTGAVRSLGLKDGDADPLWKQWKPELKLSFGPLKRVSTVLDRPLAVDAAGRLELEGVSFEPFRISLDGLPEGWVIREIQYNGHPLPSTVFEPDPAAVSHALNIFVSPVSNSITGVVSGRGKSLAGAVVLCLIEPIDPSDIRRGMKRANAGPDGRYAINTLTPGTYRIAVVPPGGEVNKTLEAIKTGAGRRIEVSPTSHTTLDLEP
jgi:protocatechuate 3,4-dioxygenase beta subunit